MTQALDNRSILHVGFGLYLLSYVLPALVGENGDFVPGYEAAYLSALGTLRFVRDPSFEMLAAAVGFITNVLVVVGYGVTALRRQSALRSSTLGFGIACAASLGAVLSTAILVIDGPVLPFAGNVLWIASTIGLAFARRSSGKPDC